MLHSIFFSGVMKLSFRRLVIRSLQITPVIIIVGGLGLYALINHQPEWVPSALVQLARQPDLLDSPEAKRCAECHQSIFDAWKESRHSVAWVSKTYIKDSEDRTKEKCLPCHIPTSVNPGEKPTPRLDRRDDGIYCVPCHVRDKAMHGPYDLYSPPHPTRADKDFRVSKFCGSCHQKTFKEWQATGSDKTCQSCHMKRQTGRLTQKLPLSWLHAKREVADHRFPKGDLSEENLSVLAAFDGRMLRVRLLNDTIPHAIPTADNGDPRLYVYVTFLNAGGKEIDTYKEIIAPQQETALSFQKPSVYDFPVPADTAAGQVTVRYKPAWSKTLSDVVKRIIKR